MAMLKLCLATLSGLLLLSGRIYADTPANCTYEDVHGVWTFYEGERSSSSDIDCSKFAGPVIYTYNVELQFPNLAVDELGNKGHWTIIYNQGFEVTINYRKYFAFSLYRQDGPNVTDICDRIFPGWSHDVLGKNWACYNAKKTASMPPKYHIEKELLFSPHEITRPSRLFIDMINSVQSSWRATHYEANSLKRLADVIKRNGGLKSKIHGMPPPALVSAQHAKLASLLPEEFDWRNVDGVNYVSPVRNQGSCGSCFAFSSMGMLESRLRIMTNNTLQVVLSPQDIVSCSEYAQGCEGGFPYLIAGKYAQDFGVVPEECNPYTGQDSQCSEKPCKRYYVAKYKYVGGFYGGCNEELMKLELVANGPIAVSFEVYPDFQQYSGGIYHHTGLRDKYNPFFITNHAVLAVGYGVDQATGEKYWIVKNSWGAQWGENGYFRIRRGTNECSIESIAVAVTPIP